MSSNNGMVVSKDLTAGTIAGVCQLIVGHPFDTIKVKLQAQPKPPPGQPPMYSGAIDAVRKTLAAEGTKGLYAGIGPPLATVAVFNAVLFTARGQMEKLLGKEPGMSLSIGQSFVAGAGAGLAVTFVACPTELVKCRLQAQGSAVVQVASIVEAPALASAMGVSKAASGSTGAATAVMYKGPMDVAHHVVKSEGGVLGLFKGLTPTLLREIPGNAAMFGAYEATKQLLAGGRDTSNLGRGHLLAAGGVAGACFWASVYPADVIKSMIQIDDYKTPKYKGTMDACRKVWATEGLPGLYRGFGPAMARSVPANAACFLAYEVVREALG